MPEKVDVCVLGAGAVGPAAADYFLKQPSVAKVTIADANLAAAKDAVRKVASPKDIRTGRCVATHLDISAFSDREIQHEFKNHRLVLSAIPASYTRALAELAIGVKTDLTDLGGVPAISTQVHQLDQAARKAGVVIVEGAGLAPGLGGSMMRAVNDDVGGRAEEIIHYVGGLGQLPQEGSYFWQRTFSAKGLVEILEPAIILEDGRLVEVDACSGGTTLTIPELQEKFPTRFDGTVESRITAGAGMSPEIMHELGVRNCREETLRWNWDLFMTALRNIPAERRVQWIEETLPHTSPAWPDIVVSWVVARKGDKESSYWMLEGFDSKLGLSAMAKTTGYSAAATALLGVQGGILPGVVSPEQLDGRTNSRLIAKLSQDLNIWFKRS